MWTVLRLGGSGEVQRRMSVASPGAIGVFVSRGAQTLRNAGGLRLVGSDFHCVHSKSGPNVSEPGHVWHWCSGTPLIIFHGILVHTSYLQFRPRDVVESTFYAKDSLSQFVLEITVVIMQCRCPREHQLVAIVSFYCFRVLPRLNLLGPAVSQDGKEPSTRFGL